MKDYSFTVPANGQTVFDCYGSDIVYCDMSDVDEFLVRVDEEEFLTFFNGRKMKYRKGYFKQVTLKNPNPVPMTINLVIGQSDIDDKVTNFSGSVAITTPSGLISHPDVTLVAGAASAVVLAANNARSAVIIANPSTNTKTFRVGGAGTGAAAGPELPPGATITLPTKAAILAFNPAGGADEKLTVAEVIS